MKKLFFLMLLAVGVATAATSVTQYGITISWVEDRTVGQYANGDYYIVGDITITSKTPASVVDGSWTKHGAMVNPTAGPTADQGFDSSAAEYSAALNAARPGGSDLGEGNPLVVTAGSSIVCAISRSTAGNRPQLSDAAVFTVVASAPPANSMRPPYCGTDKTHYWNADDLDFTILASKTPVVGTPSLATVAGYFARPWIEINTNHAGRDIHPQNNQLDYGRDMTGRLGDGLLSLMLNYTDEQKETLYMRLVQYGIDVYGAAVSGGNWTANGGHNMGRKMPMILAGLAFNDSNILAYADAETHFIFQEDQQTFTIAAGDVTTSTSASWNPDTRGVTSSVTISNGSPAQVTLTGSTLFAGCIIKFNSGTTLPSPLTSGTRYWVLGSGDTFSIASSPGGAAINTTTNGSGSHTAGWAMPYQAGDIGVFEWGIQHYSNPYVDNAAVNAIYRNSNHSVLLGHMLTALFLDAEAVWNWPHFFGYIERAKVIDDAAIYPFPKAMWNAYRDSLDDEGGAPEPPSAPSITATASGSFSIDLAWADVADETGYRVEFSLNGSDWLLATTLGINSVSWTHGGLSAGVTYYYRVAAYNSAGDSSYGTDDATTPALPPVRAGRIRLTP